MSTKTIIQEVTNKIKNKTPEEVQLMKRSLQGTVNCKGTGWKQAASRLDALEAILSLTGQAQEPEEETTKDPEPFDFLVARKYANLYNNAKKRNKGFDLTLQDVRNLLRRKRCAYTGILLTEGSNREDGLPLASDRTIDRLDPEGSYSKDNCHAVCHLANQTKNILFEKTDSELFTDMKTMGKLMETLTKKGFRGR